MDNNSNQYRVSVRFEDPDRLPISFQNDQFLAGVVVNIVPGQSEINWILKLDEPLLCNDVNNQQHLATTFILKPNGLDSELAMTHAPWKKITSHEIITLALVIDNQNCPKRIVSPEDYRNYPFVGGMRVLI